MTRRVAALLLASSLMIGACGSSEAPIGVPATPAAGTTAAAAPATEAPAGPPDAARPPTATLAVEGGDPVIGELGTWTWGDGGSDAPWLPGAALAVIDGEPLTVAVDPQVGIAAWRVRAAPADAGGPDGAAVVAGGSIGPIAFAAPAPGAWTVEVRATFAGGIGEATWFWALDVS